MFEHDFYYNEHFHHDPHKRENPSFIGDVDTTPIGGIYDVQHGHRPMDAGYHIPTVPPLPTIFSAMTETEQIKGLAQKVNELCGTIEGYNKKVEDAFTAIVNSSLCNSAYYKEIGTEEGYIPESGANYQVIHIPFLDRANQPIFIELGLAYDNTTNSGLAEDSFNASTRFIADKLIPAQNTGSSFTGTVIWKNAPIFTQEGNSYTFAITQNGFFKGYKNATADVLKKDKIRNSCGARGILVYNKELVADSFPEDSSTNKARIAVGQNYDTKERFIIVVDGGESDGCTSEQLAKLFIKYGCMVALELVSGTSVYGMNKGAMLFPPAVASEDDIPSVPESNAFWYITKRRHYHNDYVKDVAILTQKMGEEIWRRLILNEQTDYVKERVVELARNLNQEIQDRKESDTALDEKYASEVTRIDSELNRIETEYKNADVELGKRLDTEIQDRKDAINNEATERKNADDTEADTRFNQDVKKIKHVDDGNKRTYSIYRYDDTKIVENIEVYEYDKLVATLQTLSEVAKNLESETKARKEADDNLQSQITKEIADRTSANTDLQSQITKEINDRTSADTALENELNNSINEEVNNRTEADTELERALKALITAEATARENGDTELANSIATFKTDFENFETSTNADLNAKKTQIDSLITDVANIKAVNDSLQVQMASLNATVTSLQTVISNIENSFENIKQTMNDWIDSMNEFKNAINSTIQELSDKIANIDNTYVKKIGDNMTGNLVMGNCEITDVNSIETHGVKLKTESDTSVIIDSSENNDASGAIVTLSDNNGNAPILRGIDTPTQDMDAVNLKYITDNLAWINNYKELIKKLAAENS